MGECAGLCLDIDVGGLGSGYHSNQDSLLSPVFLVPENADSLVLCIEHYWWGYGSINSPYNTAQSTSTLFMCSSSAPGQPSELWEISGYVGDNTGQTDYGYSVVDSEPISVPITNVYPGDSLGFKLSGLVETYVYDISAYANIEWNLVSFSIINFVTQRLERGTWGAVKSSF